MKTAESVEGNMWILTRKEIMNKDRLKKLARGVPNRRERFPLEESGGKDLHSLQQRARKLFDGQSGRRRPQKGRVMWVDVWFIGYSIC